MTSRAVVTPLGVPLEAWRDTLAGMAPTRAASALGLRRRSRVLVLVAHADDETLGFGAALASLAADGHDVAVACLSDGAAALDALGVEVADLAARRSRELHVAVGVLGVRREPATTLPDGALRHHAAALRAVVDELVARTTPDVLVSTWAGDPHPDHAAVGAAALTAGVPAFGFPVWLTHAFHPADAPVDWPRVAAIEASPADLRAKAAAIAAYRTQLEPLTEAVEAVLPPAVLDRFTALPELIVSTG